MLIFVCLVPLTILTIYLLSLISHFSERYDFIVKKITMANAHNIDFKEDMDYLMYIIVVNSERAKELVDTERPHVMIQEAREVFQNLYELADTDYGRNMLDRILKSLNTLEDRVDDIEQNVLVSGSYDKNMESLDLNIRVLTDLIQEQIQKYIYYEATNLEVLREGIRADVDAGVRMSLMVFVLILVGALLISQKITTGITEPIRKLCEITRLAGSGDFAVRAQEGSKDELAVLNTSFNQMVEKIGNLVEDIRIEQLNLRATELKLLQAQINPHFLYNSLSLINWKAIMADQTEISEMAQLLSTFYRTTLNKGKSVTTVKGEWDNTCSYIRIQSIMHSGKFDVEQHVEASMMDCEMLNLILQPLVENAIGHGLDHKEGNGKKKLWVSGREAGDVLEFEVKDNGCGIPEEDIEAVLHTQTKGYGLSNVNHRIKLYYGEAYGLQMESRLGEGTRVLVRIPKKN